MDTEKKIDQLNLNINPAGTNLVVVSIISPLNSYLESVFHFHLQQIINPNNY